LLSEILTIQLFWVESILMFITVDIKLTAPNKLDIPAKCREKMARSTDPPECACAAANGG